MPRIVGLQELCQQPEGVIFSDYHPCVVEGLYRRGEALRCDLYGTEKQNAEMVAFYKGVYSDFFYTQLLASVDMDETCDGVGDSSRWGLFDPEALFILYDDKDIQKMVQLLTGGAV